MKITATNRQTAAAYEAAEPKQFGTLHERMKFLVKLIQDARLDSAGPTELAIATAIYDLEAEVMYHVPASPPFGKRVVAP